MTPANSALLVDRTTPDAQDLLFIRPREIVVAHAPQQVAEALARLERAGAEGLWAAGFFSYELGLLFEEKLAPLCPAALETPLLWFGLYDAPQRLSRAETDALLAKAPEGQACDIRPTIDFATYERAFERVKAYIAAGDCYQVNLTFKASFGLDGDAAGLFRSLLAAQPVAYGAYIAAEHNHVLSLSPELFIRRIGNRLDTRPMKGTLKRGRTTAEDMAGQKRLVRDEKSRAENLMIVDLLRNDLGRIAATGTVEVTDLFTVETYKTLHQMTSGITATLAPGTGFTEIIRNLFPCGSVTGAPKIRAMQIIDEVEPGPRGLYTGAIGYRAPNGDFTFNVAIRTAVIDAEGRGEIGIGGGIVADSEARAEYDEALLKMKFLGEDPQPLALIETLLWQRESGYGLLERHLARLTDSAAYFDLPLVPGTARQALADAAASFAADRMRVRLLLEATGKISVTATPLPEPKAAPVFRFMIAPERQASDNVFLYHKTTRRDVLDPPRQRAIDAHGVDEVVFLNERGELTEGSYTTLFVEEDGMLLTPPLSSGLLPGTLRAELLATGRAREQILTLADLEKAEAVYLGNSVRGLMRAEWQMDGVY